jgi:hypothetical protein
MEVLINNQKVSAKSNMNFAISCEIHDPYMCGVDWEKDAGQCPPEKRNVLSLVEEINSIGFKLSNAQLKKMKHWANTSGGEEWAIYSVKQSGHQCLSLIRYPDKKRMVFKPMTPDEVYEFNASLPM